MANSCHNQCDFCQLRVLICIFALFFSMKQNSTSFFLEERLDKFFVETIERRDSGNITRDH